nr:hypothetical protein [Tanacetum cinerariifolium]
SEKDVHVFTSGSDKTENKKHDDKAKRDDKGKSPVDLSIRVRDLRAEFEEFSSNTTNRVNAVNMPELEDIVYSDDEEDVGAEADLSNLETNISVSPIPTIRVHKDHPVNQIISDLNSAPQTRSMTRVVKEQGGLHQINKTFTLDLKTMIILIRFTRWSKHSMGCIKLLELDMPELEDIVYSDDEEDVGAEADLSNLETNIFVSPIPTIRVHKDHLVNQIIDDLNSAPQTRSMTRVVKEQ